MSGMIIRRKTFPTYSSAKYEFTTSKKCLPVENEGPHQMPYPLPQIAIKKTKDGQIVDGLQIGLFNGCWDTSERIPSIVAEIHGTQNWSFENENGNNEDCSSDVAPGNDNFSWLLNYKFNNLVPIPGIK